MEEKYIRFRETEYFFSSGPINTKNITNCKLLFELENEDCELNENEYKNFLNLPIYFELYYNNKKDFSHFNKCYYQTGGRTLSLSLNVLNILFINNTFFNDKSSNYLSVSLHFLDNIMGNCVIGIKNIFVDNFVKKIRKVTFYYDLYDEILRDVNCICFDFTSNFIRQVDILFLVDNNTDEIEFVNLRSHNSIKRLEVNRIIYFMNHRFIEVPLYKNINSHNLLSNCEKTEYLLDVNDAYYTNSKILVASLL